MAHLRRHQELSGHPAASLLDALVWARNLTRGGGGALSVRRWDSLPGPRGRGLWTGLHCQRLRGLGAQVGPHPVTSWSRGVMRGPGGATLWRPRACSGAKPCLRCGSVPPCLHLHPQVLIPKEPLLTPDSNSATASGRPGLPGVCGHSVRSQCVFPCVPVPPPKERE